MFNKHVFLLAFIPVFVLVILIVRYYTWFNLYESFNSLTEYHDSVNNPNLYLIDKGKPLPKNPSFSTFTFNRQNYKMSDMHKVVKQQFMIDDIIKSKGIDLYTQNYHVPHDLLPRLIAIKLQQNDLNKKPVNTNSAISLNSNASTNKANVLQKSTVLSNFAKRVK